MKIRLFVSAVFSAILGLGVVAVGAAPAQAAQYFNQVYPTKALCLSLASDLRTSGWQITNDCIGTTGGYRLTAVKY